MDIEASASSLAHAYAVRNEVRGINQNVGSFGRYLGSTRRLSGFVNMGSFNDYPGRPTAPRPAQPSSSMLTILAHEIGHRFPRVRQIHRPCHRLVVDSNPRSRSGPLELFLPLRGIGPGGQCDQGQGRRSGPALRDICRHTDLQPAGPVLDGPRASERGPGNVPGRESHWSHGSGYAQSPPGDRRALQTALAKRFSSITSSRPRERVGLIHRCPSGTSGTRSPWSLRMRAPTTPRRLRR